MKAQSQAVMQYSGNPLSVTSSKKISANGLSIIKPRECQKTTFIQANKISNDPKNWDANWFGCYE